MKKVHVLLRSTPLLLGAVLLAMSGCHKNDNASDLTPVFTSFSPAEAAPGATVVITGQNFSEEKTRNIVKFNNVPATVTEAKKTELSVTVPEEATDGKITVTIGEKTATSATDFKVNALAPEVSSFTPDKGVAETEVTITGKRFANDSKVYFGGVEASSVTFVGKTTLKAKVPATALTGKIKVTANTFESMSAADFKAAPRFTGLSANTGTQGTEITIVGANFSDDKAANTILFGTGAALTAEIVSANNAEIKVKAPAAGTDGKITITVNGMSVTGETVFTYVPVITDFSPKRGRRGIPVTITGNHFAGNSIVKMNDLELPITSQNATEIKVTIPDNTNVNGDYIIVKGKSQDLPTAEPFVVTGAWVSTGLSVMAKYDMMGTVIGDVLYYGMGHNGLGNNGSWESVNLKTGARKSLASFPVGNGVADPAVFVIGNDIYCGGGTYYDAGWHRSNRFFKYTIAANKWDEISPYPETYITSSMAAFAIGNEGFVGMGYPSNGDATPVSGKFYKYTPNTAGGTWTPIADYGNNGTIAANQRRKAVVFCDGTRTFVGGGEDGNLNGNSSFFEFDKATGAWKTVRANTVLADRTGVSLNDKFYLVNSSAQFLEFNPADQGWNILNTLPGTIINRPLTFAYNGAIYQAGGFTFPGGTVQTTSLVRRFTLD